MNTARDSGAFFAALDETADLRRQLHDAQRDAEHWRTLAGGAKGAPARLDAITARCQDVIEHDQALTGPALAHELLSLAGGE